ncbi:MAG TPA: 8-amino-7-oxononanoate synthase [Elusimicrobiota bacterium]|nr:8-amino-7-oxononanoate synthase [Elusimicrobiota bacterium]
MLNLEKELKDLEDRNLYRVLRVMRSAPGARVTVEGEELLNFASNNYLGLSADDRLKEAARSAIGEWGAGATASRLLGGNLELHERLERALADFKRTEACAVFPSGYHANLGTLPALMGENDTVILDRLCHASLVDGARLSRARLRVFAHNDAVDLEKVLKRAASSRGRRWIVTESVFSMDGDVAPLREIAALAARYGVQTYVDEAHATGVWGPDGRGLVNELGLEKKLDVCMGTLSKALGGAGGFVCGRRDLVEWIHNRCRSFIYSTGLPPASAATALKALEICLTEPDRRRRLFSSADRLRRGLSGFPRARSSSAAGIFESSRGPVVPFVIGSEADALALSRSLWKKGIFVPAIRPPTVPKGTARLRFSVTAEHTEADVDLVLEAMRRHAG